MLNMEINMSNLDVGPMMASLRSSPEEFEFRGGSLIHLPSRHSFVFDEAGRVTIHARCNCNMLSVQRDQEAELFNVFQQWQTRYWQPFTINREFASHFPPRSILRQTLIELTAWLHRRLSQRASDYHCTAMKPAE
jgi:hypothetical protein